MKTGQRVTNRNGSKGVVVDTTRDGGVVVQSGRPAVKRHYTKAQAERFLREDS